ncbi:MAG: hypothetical protein JWN37_243 [Candidatus Nomurabacteria bacterium]|nr:hypothetical protein [Candidatus Nomurabacteria bacterium]
MVAENKALVKKGRLSKETLEENKDKIIQHLSKDYEINQRTGVGGEIGMQVAKARYEATLGSID